MSQRRSFSFFRRKKEEPLPKPPNISSDLAMRIIEKELDLERSWDIKVIHELMALYSKMIEYYEQNNNPKYYDFQDRMHKMLIKPQVIAALQKVNCPSEEDKAKSPTKPVYSTHLRGHLTETGSSKDSLKTRGRQEACSNSPPKETKFIKIPENFENPENLKNPENPEKTDKNKSLHITELAQSNPTPENFKSNFENIEKPSEKKNSQRSNLNKSYHLAERKEQAEATRKLLSKELSRTLKRSKTNRNAGIIIERQSSITRETAQKATADFKSQDTALERRLASRKMAQLTKSMTFTTYNSNDMSRVFACDLSDLDEENNTSTKSSFFTTEAQNTENFENFEKRLEEIMEKNFSDRAMKIAELKYKYESQMNDISGLGDLHTPQRSVDIPAKFKELIVPGKAQHVVCTGNFGDRLDWLKSLGGTLHITRGDYDEGNQPESKVFTSNGWKIGVIHGHQIIPWNDKEALSSYQRILDCDILVSGHSHILSIEAQESKYYINPGSLTGSYSSTTSDVTPSFLLLSTSPQGSSVYSYELAEDNLLIKRTEITKLS